METFLQALNKYKNSILTKLSIIDIDDEVVLDLENKLNNVYPLIERIKNDIDNVQNEDDHIQTDMSQGITLIPIPLPIPHPLSLSIPTRNKYFRAYNLSKNERKEILHKLRTLKNCQYTRRSRAKKVVEKK